jgi:uncharacterized repeat protein (TIGR01451 family)
MSSKAIRGARTLFLAGLAAFLAVATAQAQTYTPEGTVITNTASVDYTDANGSDYTPVTAQVSVTVGFIAGLDVTPDGGSQNPGSPQGATTMAFTITNIGNGTDQVELDSLITGDAVFDSIGYNWNSTNYLSLASLNADLALHDIAADDNIVVNVVYKIASGMGGLSANYQLTATSLRDNPATSDSGDYDLTIAMTLGVTVTPDGGQSLVHLPTGTQPDYQFTFNVENTGNVSETFRLVASEGVNGAVVITTVNGVSGDSTDITLASGANQDIVVEYQVVIVPDGTQDTVYLRATSETGPGDAEDNGFADFTVNRPVMSITKRACWVADCATGDVAPDSIAPGDSFWYHIDVENTGSVAASAVTIDDDLPIQVYKVGEAMDPFTVWSITTTGTPGVDEHVNAVYPGTLAAGPVRWIAIQVTVY